MDEQLKGDDLLTPEEVSALFAARGIPPMTMQGIVEQRIKLYKEKPQVLQHILNPHPPEECR